MHANKREESLSWKLRLYEMILIAVLFPGSPQVQLSCLLMADDSADEFVGGGGGDRGTALLMLPDLGNASVVG